MTISSSEKPRNGPVTITLDDADLYRIASLASAKKRTPHYLMKEAILEYLQKEEARQNFIAAAESSFVHFKETVGFTLPWMRLILGWIKFNGIRIHQYLHATSKVVSTGAI